MAILGVETPVLHAPGGPPLPCLSSNNCIDPQAPDPLHALSAQHRKSASALAWNVQALAEKHGIERIGFLTLTFAEHILDPATAQERFRSLRSNVLAKRYGGHIRVFERQKSGRIHYHLLVVMSSDIRTGFDFEEASREDYSSAGPALRSEWAFWRSAAKRYGFGRTELLPVRSTHEGIARYVGKYISKHVQNRQERDKGVRLVEYSRDGRIANTCFAWATEGGRQWRGKLAQFGEMVGEQHGVVGLEYPDLKILLGPKWAYHHRSSIAEFPDLEPL